jgi:hypothetical protein
MSIHFNHTNFVWVVFHIYIKLKVMKLLSLLFYVKMCQLSNYEIEIMVAPYICCDDKVVIKL